jgi:hypothetical protein
MSSCQAEKAKRGARYTSAQVAGVQVSGLLGGGGGLKQPRTQNPPVQESGV